MTRREVPHFDPIAHAYQGLEYIALGPLLQRVRTCWLPWLAERRPKSVLALGDGDGRALARLLALAPGAEADAVDASGAMLGLLRQRCSFAGERLRTHQADVLDYLPERTPDVITAHFVFDCFEQPQLDLLIQGLTHAAPQAAWLVSDFRVPSGLMRLPAWLYVRTLYLIFKAVTGLRATSLPDHGAALRRGGLTLVHERRFLFGMLISEVWMAARP